MGYGFSLELKILITTFAEVHRVIMINSSPSILQHDISSHHFHVGEAAEAAIGLEPRFTNLAAPAHCSRPVYQKNINIPYKPNS